MKQRGGILLVLAVVIGLVIVAAAVLLHSPALHKHMAALPGAQNLHGGGPAAVVIGDAGGDEAAVAQARDGVAAIGKRWDEAAFAETVALYTAVHRDVEWPGVLAAEIFAYGPDEQQTLELYRPEQGFSEPGPVLLFIHGNGLGNSDRVAPGSDGLIYSHLGKLAATVGGIGVSMNYRNVAHDDSQASLAAGAEDLGLVIEWIRQNIAPYGGDTETIVVVANSEGATAAAAYLFNEAWQTESGHGVAAAVLSSGLFGSLAPAIEGMVDDYGGEPVPLALWSAEYDTDEVVAGIADLHDILCRKYDGCPWYEQLDGHNHVSALLSLGTSDTDAMNRFIRFYHTVR